MSHDVSTYISFGKSQISRFKESVFIDTNQGRLLLLEVTEGQQKGSTAVLQAQSFTVGDSFDSDVFVADGEGQVSISQKHTVVGTLLTIETQRKDVLANGKPIKTGQVTVRNPCVLQIAQTHISCKDVVRKSKQSSGVDKSAHLKVALICILLALSTGLFLFEGKQPTQALARTVSSPDEFKNNNPTPMKRANSILEGSTFKNVISITQRDGFTYQLEGTIAQSLDKDWQAVRQSLDQAFHGYNLLNQVVTAPALIDIPAVSMVFRGNNPFLLLLDGSKVAVGDELTNNWLLEAIGDDYLIVTRASETMTLAY